MSTARETITRLLSRKVLILDGATGTELQRRGMPAGVCPELWCLENPAVLRDIHEAYVRAGADVIYTGSFGANDVKLRPWVVEDTAAVNRELALLARRAASRALVAGDIGPTGRFVEPFGDLPFEEAVALFRTQVRGLITGGVDLIVIETMMDIQEARAALIAVRETTDLFCAVTMTYEESGRTLNGTSPVAALVTLQSLGADAVGCNCSLGPEGMVDLLRAMKPYAKVPLVAKPNAGMPRLCNGEAVFEMSPAAFGAATKALAAAGANMVGGCCGTTPAHIATVKATLAGTKPSPPVHRPATALSSARDALLLEPGGPLLLIGERINPTGKKELQEELRAGRTTLVRAMAREQERLGAHLLDVNVGAAGIDEVAAMRVVLSVLATVSPLPLVIDSPRPDSIAAALRLYPGRVLINSISGEQQRRERLLPLARRYGAMFILLPLVDGEVPATATRRREIIAAVLAEAATHGFTREDVVVDGLVMTVAAQPSAAQEALRTVAWASRRLRCRTVLGLSNISFGMPGRSWLNAAFLCMAQAAGLTMAIANPASTELMHLKAAGDLLLQKDPDAVAYLRHFATAAALPTSAPAAVATAGGPQSELYQAILEGNRQEAASLAAATLAAGGSAQQLIDEVMIPAIVRVGELYERKELFLPQLMASAEAMKEAIAILAPHLVATGAAASCGRGVVLLATVQGDVHDIGKNIVALLLKNHGYHVVDLGKDVAAPTIVAAARDCRADVVGLSALMTTTMVRMEEIIALARKEGLGCRFILGGAVVTKAYAASLGAAYAKDGVEAVQVVANLIGGAEINLPAAARENC